MMKVMHHLLSDILVDRRGAAYIKLQPYNAVSPANQPLLVSRRFSLKLLQIC